MRFKSGRNFAKKIDLQPKSEELISIQVKTQRRGEDFDEANFFDFVYSCLPNGV
jgi:hypothetical protein